MKIIERFRFPVEARVVVGAAALAALIAGRPATAADNTPIPVSPMGELSQRCPTFSWTEVASTKAYELVIYRVGNGGDVATDPVLRRRLPAGAQSWTPAAGHCLAPGSRYAWSIRALGGDDTTGFESWSDAALVDVAAAPSIDEVERAIETLRRYLRRQGEGPVETGSTSRRSEDEERGAPSSSEGIRSSFHSGPGTSGGSSRDRSAPPGSVSADRLALSSATTGPLAVSTKTTMSSTPSLTVSDQIHLGVASDFFKDGDLFLWDDSSSSNLGLGRNALSSASGTATGNTAIGYRSLEYTNSGPYPVQGSENTAVGGHSLRSNTTGLRNTGLGFGAMARNTSGYNNTATGHRALLYNIVGSGNTAVGVGALLSDTNFSISYNTATGAFALSSNVADGNTASGFAALTSNTTGDQNVAVGYRALGGNTTGFGNTAVGWSALDGNPEGANNTAIGRQALAEGSGGFKSVAIGYRALEGSSGGNNTGIGSFALLNNQDGKSNTACGYGALRRNQTGSQNIGLGRNAGSSAPTDASRNVYIAHGGDVSDTDAKGPTIRIGEDQNRTFVAGIHNATLSGSNEHQVCIDDANQLGACSVSSARFKKDVTALDVPTGSLFALEPVSFRYRNGILGGPTGRRIGLIADQVAEVFPELVTRNEEGRPFGVRYELLSVLLLDELQRQQALNESQTGELMALRRRLAAVEDGRPNPDENKSWWRRILGARKSP